MRKVKIMKDKTVWFESPSEDKFGCEINYSNNQSVEFEFNDLSNANLWGADLSNADLRNAGLRYADLRDTNLRYANLRYADLRYANLSNADLRYAGLRYANLSNADLRYADLSNAGLRDVDLSNANLRYANLWGADLWGADLDEKELPRKGIILKENKIAYKKCGNGDIVTLKIPKGSIVFNINNSKCRTNIAKCVAINGKKGKKLKAISKEDKDFIYQVGKTYEIEDFDLTYNVECSTGIHFFWTEQEAKDY